MNSKLFRHRITLPVRALALAFCLTLLTGLSWFVVPAPMAAQAQTRAGREESPAAVARQTLASIDGSKLARVKDARLRASAQRVYDALKALADNTAKEREAALLANYDQALNALDTLGAQPGYSYLKLADCSASKKNCQDDCKAAGKTFCGCRLLGAACYFKAIFL